MSYQTYTNDPMILDWVETYKKAAKAYEDGLRDEQQALSEPVVDAEQYRSILKKADDARETLNTVTMGLSTAFIFALEHPTEVAT